ncbi:MAG TPA: hypothetical protein VN426_11105 [Syntrophomonadaceae bacterium]|nr:hypothetical protein [Syntrophomonadaceae bacterium]
MLKKVREGRTARQNGNDSPVTTRQPEWRRASIKVSSGNTVTPCINCQAEQGYVEMEEDLYLSPETCQTFIVK